MEELLCFFHPWFAKIWMVGHDSVRMVYTEKAFHLVYNSGVASGVLNQCNDQEVLPLTTNIGGITFPTALAQS